MRGYKLQSIPLFLYLCIFFSGAQIVKAQEIEEGVFIDTSLRYMPSVRAKVMEGNIEIIDEKDAISYAFKVADVLPVKVSIENRYISLKENVPVSLPSKLVGISTPVEITLPFFSVRDTYLQLGISPSFYADTWECRSSAFRIPSWVCGIYQPSPEWTYIVGVAILPDFELEAVPIIGCIYKPNNRFTISIIPTKRSEVSYNFSKMITFFVEGGFSSDEFEVKRETQNGVILCYQDMWCGTGVGVTVNKYLRTTFSVGGTFSRSLYYRDRIGKVNIDNGIYTEGRVEVRF